MLACRQPSLAHVGCAARSCRRRAVALASDKGPPGALSESPSPDAASSDASSGRGSFWDDDGVDSTSVQYSPWKEDEYVVHDDAVPDTFEFKATKRVKLRVTPDTLERAMRRTRRDFVYEHTLSELCIELVKLQEYIKTQGLKVVVIFEGRDAAGKGGVISRIASAMSPRICRIVALSAPSERERTQWYFQRYVAHLPSAGEIVLFDRSWYNRAGVERVMGFCTNEEYEAFIEDVPRFERMLVETGKIHIIKYWLDVSDIEQEARFEGRLHRSWKRWKLSPMDLFARSKWSDYAFARNEMLRRTDHPYAPWLVVPSDNKRASRLNCISDLLSRIAYTDIAPAPLSLPARDSAHVAPMPAPAALDAHPVDTWRYVAPLYDNETLNVEAKLARDLALVAAEAQESGHNGVAERAAADAQAARAFASLQEAENEEDDDGHFVHGGDD